MDEGDGQRDYEPTHRSGARQYRPAGVGQLSLCARELMRMLTGLGSLGALPWGLILRRVCE